MFKMSRRFGKTLNLSILQSFFEMGFEDTEKNFSGLEILKTGESMQNIGLNIWVAVFL